MAAVFTWDVAAVTTADGVICAQTQDLPLPDGTAAPFTVTMPPAAVGSRMVAYKLDTPAAAFEAIMREHGCRQAGIPFDPADTTTIAIAYAAGADTQRDSELAANADAIQEAVNVRTGVAATPAGGQATLPPPITRDAVSAAAGAAAAAVLQIASPNATPDEIAAATQAAKDAAANALPA